VDVGTKDELGELASAFNQMSADLDRADALRQQMTADIAHELRTPLTVIHGHLEGLRDGVLKSSPERIDVLYTETEQLMRLVEDLRTLSLADAGALPLYRHPTDPVDLLERAVVAFTPQAQQQGISIQLLPDRTLPKVNVDPQRMGQVLGNLLNNALSNTPREGRIELYATANASRVVLKVQDNGKGIPSEELFRVFDRFFRVESSRGKEGVGTGLGLSIAKSIVEAHDGTIEVESALGEGTAIQISLPI
jgi:signal transduction histidine kinase